MPDAELNAVITKIAANLGFTPTVQDEEWPGSYIEHADGRKLFLRRDWRKPERIVVDGAYPKTGYYRPNLPSISVAINRGPDVIAREIERRFLPDYNEHFTKLTTQIAQGERDTEARNKIAEHLAVRLGDGATITDSPNNAEATVRWRIPDSLVAGEIRLHGDGSKATFEVRSAPFGLATAIAEAIGRQVAEEARTVCVNCGTPIHRNGDGDWEHSLECPEDTPCWAGNQGPTP